ncbi:MULTISPECIES: pyrroloquinoline quinone biosynthesis protein PqqF [unclassified Pseudomonas]|uniref:pyrroloquinoline quinone biosynthesis protein PqqF n=1 Tax=unclassified Pseudomonas TaxID=196821 RepID=UPI0024490B8D|nr:MULTISPECIES: pyrroloquinoline quinone biosynthesis protein PqqF [unclassified Pseudomonas]MDH0301397.1 pyrroloquinoline quinone biosynthesis protein PqqF [Pseudomonas sp. GD04091]MDH1985847.1 pyrroloquinoline quinone biosynthesis protein PqqF [Pseudomonas sp. GD03689]
MSDATRHLTLANGLHLTLRHAPRLKRAAAALRVHAGSHDAPARWPGLAHFLEHLFFLGTARFPLEDGLMRYVQGLGGQVNASTRERTTDFFFEVPPDGLAGGLERLCQMLAEPDLGIERQRREREVIHAEFIAWSRYREAQRQFALLQSVSARHPLSGFHAGNRYSLPLQDRDFQQGLKAFHQRFYQGGQITLSLTGPQSLDELERSGKRFGTLFGTGQRIAQKPPPELLAGPLRQPTASGTDHDLLFAHEGLPADAEQALELLLSVLTDNRPGGWLAELDSRGWLQDCNAQLLHAHAGQMLWQIRLQLTAPACIAQSRDLLHGWLSDLRQQDRQRLNSAFSQLQQRREQAASALELARRDSAGLPYQGLGARGLAALDALLASFPSNTLGQWHLPGDDPLLAASLPKTHAPIPAGLSVSNCLPPSRQFAALYLHWHVPSPLRRRWLPVLERSLQSLRQRAGRASLQLDFTASGEYWQLRAAGHPLAVIALVEEALPLLRAPAAQHWGAPIPVEPALIPIRMLLKVLPDELLTDETPSPPDEPPMPDALWQNARWQGLAAGFDDAQQGALGAALHGIMGQPGERSSGHRLEGRHWRQISTAGNEPALLLFCPLPEPLQAPGRLLAQRLQGPVYQRLRVELQLGYAVFSAFRQIEGHAGLLFGVQSPHASHSEILDHLTTLLKEGVSLDRASRQCLANQFNETAMTNADVVEWAWQAHMAKQNSDLSHMSRSILSVEQCDLDAVLRQLIDAEHGWLCLANAAAPDSQWH